MCRQMWLSEVFERAWFYYDAAQGIAELGVDGGKWSTVLRLDGVRALQAVRAVESDERWSRLW